MGKVTLFSRGDYSRYVTWYCAVIINTFTRCAPKSNHGPPRRIPDTDLFCGAGGVVLGVPDTENSLPHISTLKGIPTTGTLSAKMSPLPTTDAVLRSTHYDGRNQFCKNLLPRTPILEELPTTGISSDGSHCYGHQFVRNSLSDTIFKELTVTGIDSQSTHCYGFRFSKHSLTDIDSLRTYSHRHHSWRLLPSLDMVFLRRFFSSK